MAPGGAIARISKVLVLSYIVDWIFVMYASTSLANSLHIH